MHTCQIKLQVCASGRTCVHTWRRNLPLALQKSSGTWGEGPKKVLLLLSKIPETCLSGQVQWLGKDNRPCP